MTTQGSLTRERMLAEMQQALDEEIAEKNAKPNIKHTAVDGKLISEGNGQYAEVYLPKIAQSLGVAALASSEAEVSQVSCVYADRELAYARKMHTMFH